MKQQQEEEEEEEEKVWSGGLNKSKMRKLSQ